MARRVLSILVAAALVAAAAAQTTSEPDCSRMVGCTACEVVTAPAAGGRALLGHGFERGGPQGGPRGNFSVDRLPFNASSPGTFAMPRGKPPGGNDEQGMRGPPPHGRRPNGPPSAGWNASTAMEPPRGAGFNLTDRPPRPGFGAAGFAGGLPFNASSLNAFAAMRHGKHPMGGPHAHGRPDGTPPGDWNASTAMTTAAGANLTGRPRRPNFGAGLNQTGGALLNGSLGALGGAHNHSDGHGQGFGLGRRARGGPGGSAPNGTLPANGTDAGAAAAGAAGVAASARQLVGRLFGGNRRQLLQRGGGGGGFAGRGGGSGPMRPMFGDFNATGAGGAPQRQQGGGQRMPHGAGRDFNDSSGGFGGHRGFDAADGGAPAAQAPFASPQALFAANRAALMCTACAAPAYALGANGRCTCAPGYGVPRPANATAGPAAPACERCPAGFVSGPDAPAPPAPSPRPGLGGAVFGGRAMHAPRAPHGLAHCIACPSGTAASEDQTKCV